MNRPVFACGPQYNTVFRPQTGFFNAKFGCLVEKGHSGDLPNLSKRSGGIKECAKRAWPPILICSVCNKTQSDTTPAKQDHSNNCATTPKDWSLPRLKKFGF